MSDFKHEQQLLRLLTLYPKTILECGELKGTHFGAKHHGVVFDLISGMYDAGKEVSIVSVGVESGSEDIADTLMTLANIQVDGGGEALSDAIIDACLGRRAARMVSDYIAPIKMKRGRVALISELIDRLSKLVSEKTEQRLTTADVIADRMLEVLRNPDQQRTSVKTGIHKLDDHTGGIQKGLLTIVSGVPGMGKSTLLANMIVNMASLGEHVYLSSLEDRDLFVVGRMISRMSQVNAESINKCQNIGFNELREIESAVEINREILSRIHIDDSSGQSVSGIRRTCSMLKNEGKLTVAYVDHLGEVSKAGRNKYDAATANAEGLRDIANDLDIPMISGAQVARSAVSGAASGGNINHMDCIPRSHHLRDSGRIEEVARNIWFVHRPHRWNNKEDESDFWVNIDKATHGKPKIIKLKTKLETMTITDDGDEYGQKTF